MTAIFFSSRQLAHRTNTARRVLAVFEGALDCLTLTVELPLERGPRFLDLELTLLENHVCWVY